MDSNFKDVLNFFEDTQTHEQLLDYLSTGNIWQRQISAIKLSTILSKNDAKILTSNLTGQDGKIREVVSLKISEFSANNELKKYFQFIEIYKIILESLTDINGNICRNTLTTIKNLSAFDDFCNYFIPELYKMTDELTDKVLLMGDQDGKYKVNKSSFKLYWCLEALFVLGNLLKPVDLVPILKKAKYIQDYTIREKVAKILSLKYPDDKLEEIRTYLKKDENYYVRRY